MSVKIKWNGSDITNVVSSHTWSGSDEQTTRTLDIETINAPNDSHHKIPDIKLGDVLEFFESNKILFRGTVVKRDRKGEAGTISISANDYLYHLTKSKMNHVYKKKTPEYITKNICSSFGIKKGTIAKTKVKIKKLLCEEITPYNAIIAAYQKARKKNGKKYMIVMQDGVKLSVIEKGKVVTTILQAEGGITEATYSENMDSMINKVLIYNSKGKKIGTVSDKTWVKKYGLFQEVLKVEKGKGKTEAKAMLEGIEKTIDLSGIGDIKCISGYGIRVKDSASGLTGTFYITSDSHTFTNGIHTMSLGLSLTNVMETAETSSSSGSSSSSTSSSSTSLSASGSKKADKVIALAKTFIGKVKYNMGSSSPQSGISDCSGFTQYIYKKAAGISIGRNTDAQVRKGKKVARSQLQPGDLVMFKNTYKSGYIYGVSHVGISLGGSKFIDCGGNGVHIQSLTNSYYSAHFLMGRRVL